MYDMQLDEYMVEQVQKRKMLWKKPGSGGGEEESKSATAPPAAPASQGSYKINKFHKFICLFIPYTFFFSEICSLK